MALKKCPRCELNYILDDGALCTVCRREVKGESGREGFFELCSVCNENPALPGKDMCLFCLKEMQDDKEEDKDAVEVENTMELGDASDMREIELEQDDIPGAELGEIDRELSLDDVLAEEESLDDGEEKPEDEM